MMDTATQLKKNEQRLAKMTIAIICKFYKGHEPKRRLLQRMAQVRKQIEIGRQLLLNGK